LKGKRVVEQGDRGKGFTLIELLIVVLIISILAAIALPNFLEAQTRAKLARVASDMRVLITALEAYCVDNDTYPKRHAEELDAGLRTDRLYFPTIASRQPDFAQITTPITYLTNAPLDVFDRANPQPLNKIEYYDTLQVRNYLQGLQGGNIAYAVISVGPDGYFGLTHASYKDYPRTPLEFEFTYYIVYDVTNGTISPGNIYRFSTSENPADVLKPR
jgi:prepilin-type N-terminal cleavage/methylation domain-containing protein